MNMLETFEAEDIPAEVDFSGSVPNPFAAILAEESAERHRKSNTVVLDPDVFQVFPDGRSVNEALRTLIRLRAA